jgi:hypothetical protein
MQCWYKEKGFEDNACSSSLGHKAVEYRNFVCINSIPSSMQGPETLFPTGKKCVGDLLRFKFIYVLCINCKQNYAEKVKTVDCSYKKMVV